MILNDTQLVLLSAAAQRPDNLLVPPERLVGRAAQLTAAKLIKAGLVREVSVGRDAPAWDRDFDNHPTGLKITNAGLVAIGIEEPTAEDDDGSVRENTKRLAVPRAGSKRALIVDMLVREGGASLADLVAATDWLPHTTRAALTGLRKAGFDLERCREGASTRYRIRLSPTAGEGHLNQVEA